MFDHTEDFLVTVCLENERQHQHSDDFLLLVQCKVVMSEYKFEQINTHMIKQFFFIITKTESQEIGDG